MAKKPTEQGSISFGKRIGEGTSMAVDRLAQVAVHDQLPGHQGRCRPRAGRSSTRARYGSCDVCGQPDPRGSLEALRGPCSASRTPPE